MRLAEAKKMERNEVAYNLLLCKMIIYKEQLEKVTLYRRHNKNGRLLADVVCYLTDNSGNTHVEKFRLYDDEYLWILTAFEQDFPEVDFEDLTADKDKLVKDNDIQH